MPYLKSVKDPYDGISPDHTWTVRYSQGEMESKLSGLFSGRLRKIKVLKRGDSPRIVAGPGRRLARQLEDRRARRSRPGSA